MASGIEQPIMAARGLELRCRGWRHRQRHGDSISAGGGVTLIIEGTAEAQQKLERVMRTDPGIGVIRYADAGYESLRALIAASDLVAPMLPEDAS